MYVRFPTRNPILRSAKLSGYLGINKQLWLLDLISLRRTSIRSLPNDSDLVGISKDGRWAICVEAIRQIGPMRLVAIELSSGKRLILWNEVYSVMLG